MSVKENMSLTALDLRWREAWKHKDEQPVGILSAPSPTSRRLHAEQAIGLLPVVISKVAIARGSSMTRSKVLILDEVRDLRGVTSLKEIYQLINCTKADGLSDIILSI